MTEAIGCIEEERLVALGEGELALPQEIGHLASCPVCARLLASCRADDLLLEEMTGTPVGLVFGRYRQCVGIARGGMSEVYLGCGPELQPVAVKVCRQRELLPFFRREVEMLQRCAELGLDGIVPLRDHDLGHQPAYLVTDFIPGGTLADRLGRGALPPDEVVRLMQALGRILAGLASQGIVHGDLKPGNIIMDRNGRPLLIDLGAGRNLLCEALRCGQGLTTIKAPALTVAYAAPEQIRGQPAGHASDIFALGAVLYELATGHHPFVGGTAWEISARILSGVPPAPNPLDHLPWMQLLRCCLDPEPGRRPSAVALASGTRGGNRSMVRRTWQIAGLVLGFVAAIALAILLVVVRREPSPPYFLYTDFPDPQHSRVVCENWGHHGKGCVYDVRYQDATGGRYVFAITLQRADAFVGVWTDAQHALDLRRFQSLSFRVHGGERGGQRLALQLVRARKAKDGNYQVIEHPLPSPVAGGWQTVRLSLDELGAHEVDDLTGVRFRPLTGPVATFLVDDLALEGRQDNL